MDLIYVDSTSIDQIGYDEDQHEAHVVFKNGRHYVYSEVSQDAWDRFKDAPSKGKFINEEFKAKGFPYRQV
jgi:hypothetical protein